LSSSTPGPLFALVLTLAAGCAGPPAEETQPAARSLFVEITSDAFVDSQEATWPDGTFFLPEIMGGGIALFDHDNDGDLDLLQVRVPAPGRLDDPAPNRLFEQTTDGRFVDVTERSGLGDPGFGQGIAIGDADNDGDLDVYFTNFGRDAYYRNEGDGRFVESTAEAGLEHDAWSSSATFVDYDRDGDLDLFVVHYLVMALDARCQGTNLAPDYCGPKMFPGVRDTLYRNDGGGKFTDVSENAGIATAGKGLGVVALDLTDDGRIDFYVANDKEVNHLWVGNADGTFTDEAILRGLGFNAHGAPEASMGLAVNDADGDGRLDLFVTHLLYESNTLYVATEHGVYADRSDAAGLAVIDRPYTGFGCGFVDFDHDGDMDLAVANGRVSRARPVAGAPEGEFWSNYVEPNLLFRNDGDARFTDVSPEAGTFSSRLEVGRGLALGDIDNDGDIDLALGNLGGLPRLFRNDAPAPGTHWLIVRAMTGDRDALGARVTLHQGNHDRVGAVLPGASYGSSNDARVHFGLGSGDRIDAIEVRWPDGRRERFPAGAVDRQVVVRKGEGEAS